MRPGPFGVNEIRGERGNPAPIVDPGVEKILVVRRGKVRWRLKVYAWHDQAGHRYSAQHILLGRFRPILHGDGRLGAEILDDDFLDMAVALVQVANGKKGIDPIVEGFSDANQKPG